MHLVALGTAIAIVTTLPLLIANLVLPQGPGPVLIAICLVGQAAAALLCLPHLARAVTDQIRGPDRT